MSVCSVCWRGLPLRCSYNLQATHRRRHKPAGRRSYNCVAALSILLTTSGTLRSTKMYVWLTIFFKKIWNRRFANNRVFNLLRMKIARGFWNQVRREQNDQCYQKGERECFFFIGQKGRLECFAAQQRPKTLQSCSLTAQRARPKEHRELKAERSSS